MKSSIPYLFFLLTLSCAVQSQNTATAWKGKKCAVALTYDDALNVHLDNAIPLLDSLGFKGTFYLSAYFPGCKDRIDDWRKAAARGHELGNHTLYHPCASDKPGRSWVSPDRALEKYSMNRIVDEIRMTNVFLKAIDGKSKRTFAYTCGDMTVGDSSFVPHIKGDFVSARGVHGVMVPIDTKDLYNVGAYGVNGESGDQLIALVKEAMQKNALIVFLFHGVGGEHGINVGLKEHRQLLRFLKQHEKEIWIAPFLDVTEYIQERAVAKK